MSDYLSTQTRTRDTHTQLKLEMGFYEPCTADSNNPRLSNRGKPQDGSLEQLLSALMQRSAGRLVCRWWQNTGGNSFPSSRLYQQDLGRTATDMALGTAAVLACYEPEM